MILGCLYEKNIIAITHHWFDSDIGIRFFMRLQYAKKLFDCVVGKCQVLSWIKRVKFGS